MGEVNIYTKVYIDSSVGMTSMPRCWGPLGESTDVAVWVFVGPSGTVGGGSN